MNKKRWGISHSEILCPLRLIFAENKFEPIAVVLHWADVPGYGQTAHGPLLRPRKGSIKP